MYNYKWAKEYKAKYKQNKNIYDIWLIVEYATKYFMFNITHAIPRDHIKVNNKHEILKIQNKTN